MQISDVIVFGSVVGEAQQQPILIVEEIKTIISGDLGQNCRTIQVILGFGSVYRLAGANTETPLNMFFVSNSFYFSFMPYNMDLPEAAPL